jgi:outer membrane receptor for ferrienterochelin and colicin
VAVVSKRGESEHESPAIVSVVERREIVQSGARDLSDILQQVPGFALTAEAGATVSMGFRGHYGGLLILVDGQEMNERAYALYSYGMSIPADIIERVEIIRGPGSVSYGGFAELGVINVVTRSAKDIDGAAAGVYYGRGADYNRIQVTGSVGREFQSVPGLGMSLHLTYGTGSVFTGTYTDYAGQSFLMAPESAITTTMVDGEVHYKGLQLRYIYEDHFNKSRDGFGPVLGADDSVRQTFETHILDLHYDWKLPRGFVFTPRITYKRQTPWQDYDGNNNFYDKTIDNLRVNLSAQGDLFHTNRHSLQLLVGAEGFWDHGRINDPATVMYQGFNGETTVSYGDLAGYAQLFWKNPWANVAAGARYEWHNQFGGSTVPRLAVTKVWNAWNFKLVYNQAFRAPGIENLRINPQLQPEYVHTVEAEVGYQFSEHFVGTANAYWLRFEQPIVLTIDPTANQVGYVNGDSTGTAGVEAELRVRYPWMYASLSYSFYSTSGQNVVDYYKVPGHDDVTLAIPAHKVAINTGFTLWRDHVTIGATAVYMSERFGYLHADDMGMPVLGAAPNLFLLNANLAYRNLGMRGLDLSVGVFNLLGAQYQLLQAFTGGHPPMTYGGREVFARLTYNFGGQ